MGLTCGHLRLHSKGHVYSRKRKDWVCGRNWEHLYPFSVFLSMHLCELANREVGRKLFLSSTQLFVRKQITVDKEDQGTSWVVPSQWSLGGSSFLTDILQFSHDSIHAHSTRSLSWIYSSDTICIAWSGTRLQPFPDLSFTARVQLCVLYTLSEDDFCVLSSCLRLDTTKHMQSNVKWDTGNKTPLLIFIQSLLNQQWFSTALGEQDLSQWNVLSLFILLVLLTGFHHYEIWCKVFHSLHGETSTDQ